ncbi:hypothetical protein B2G74_22225 [Burkholderia sp. A27]|nr:hypothetical protein B2G74_22225 [Burkholderia sp. A27]
MTQQAIKLALIRIDGGTQSRASINEDTVADYAEAITGGAKLPAVIVFHDGTDLWLADGFHRYRAHNKIGALDIDADVRNGTQADAKLFAYGANKDHGLRRTNEDKKKAVIGMLTDFGEWTDNRIANHVGVDHKTVAAHRTSILGNSQDTPSVRTAERNRKTYAQNTTNIGKAARAKPTIAPAAAEVQPEPAAPAGEYGPSAEELAYQEECEKADQDAYNALVEVSQSDDRLAAALKLVADQAREIVRLKALVRTLEESRDGRMNQCNQHIRMIKSLERKLKKYEKAAA